MKEYLLKEAMDMPDVNFPIKIRKYDCTSNRNIFSLHWHEHLEILFFLDGSAIIECDDTTFEAKKGDVLIVNSNQFHSGKTLGSNVSYYCLIVNLSLVESANNDKCQKKYIDPILQNTVTFQNMLFQDQEASLIIKKILSEYNAKETAYELAIKSLIFQLFILLFRGEKINVLTLEQAMNRKKNSKRIRKVLEYIQQNYTQDISLSEICLHLNISLYHFCRLFKKFTNQTFIEYLRDFRIARAENLLLNTDMNINEIAQAVGFSDSNYFSRIFKKIKKITPTEMSKNKSIE